MVSKQCISRELVAVAVVDADTSPSRAPRGGRPGPAPADEVAVARVKSEASLSFSGNKRKAVTVS
jgi:hypothetical protein